MEGFWDPVWGWGGEGVASVGGSLFTNSNPFVPRVAGAGQVPKGLFGCLSGGTRSSRPHLTVEVHGTAKAPPPPAPASLSGLTTVFNLLPSGFHR